VCLSVLAAVLKLAIASGPINMSDCRSSSSFMTETVTTVYDRGGPVDECLHTSVSPRPVISAVLWSA